MKSKVRDKPLIGGPDERLLSVMLEQILVGNVASLKLPIPEDTRLRKIYENFLNNPGDNRTLEEWGKIVGATKRKLSRHFKFETGMSFGQWRQQIRIIEALKRLGMNDSVTSIAIELGYENMSSFISMFKKTLGQTPGRYLI